MRRVVVQAQQQMQQLVGLVHSLVLCLVVLLGVVCWLVVFVDVVVDVVVLVLVLVLVDVVVDHLAKSEQMNWSMVTLSQPSDTHRGQKMRLLCLETQVHLVSVAYGEQDGWLGWMQWQSGLQSQPAVDWNATSVRVPTVATPDKFSFSTV